MVFHWNSSDNKSSQASKTLLNVLVDFDIAVVWMVSIRPNCILSMFVWVYKFFFKFLADSLMSIYIRW